MCALVLLGVATSAFASAQDVLADAADGRIDACYSRADFRDAKNLARDDQRLYGTAIDVVTVPGQPCGSGRTVPSSAIAVSSSGASTVWAGAVLLVAAGAAGAWALARRRGRGDAA